MRLVLGILSGLPLASLVLQFAHAIIFGKGWDAEEYGFSRNHLVTYFPVLYLAYAFVCAVTTLGAKMMLASGIVAHGLMAVYWIKFFGQTQGSFGIFMSLVLAMAWLARYAEVRQKEVERIARSQASPRLISRLPGNGKSQDEEAE